MNSTTARAPRAPTASHESAPVRRAPQQRPFSSEANDQFEDALRRHLFDEEAPHPPEPEVSPGCRAQGHAIPAPFMSRQPEVAAASSAGPRTSAAQDGVSAHLRALGSTPTEATAGHWQLQWAGRAAPVQQVELRRADSGALHLDLSATVHATDPARLARLRDRIAARSPTSEVYVGAGPRPAPKRGEQDLADQQRR